MNIAMLFVCGMMIAAAGQMLRIPFWAVMLAGIVFTPIATMMGLLWQ